MKSLLHQLENNEAILLMYLAGELPEEDRREVGQWLAGDGGMRAELATLTALRSDVQRHLVAQDAARPLSGGAAAGRLFAGAVRRQHLINLAKPAAPARKGNRFALWMYPAVAAAVLMVVMGVWYKVAQDPTARPIASQFSDDAPVPADRQLAGIWSSPAETDLFAQLLPDAAEAEMQDAIALREMNH